MVFDQQNPYPNNFPLREFGELKKNQLRFYQEELNDEKNLSAQ
jgi:hypothetical protein